MNARQNLDRAHKLLEQVSVRLSDQDTRQLSPDEPSTEGLLVEVLFSALAALENIDRRLTEHDYRHVKLR